MPQSKDMTGLGGVSSVNSGRSIISTLVSGDDHHAAASCRLFFPAQSPGVNDILEIVWRLFGDCLEIVWRLFGDCLEIVWRLFGDCLEIVWRLFGDCCAVTSC